MTSQIREKITILFEEYQISGEPLKNYLNTRNDISFKVTSTGCWRGYVGTWEIKNGALYLIDLSGLTEDGEINLKTLFGAEEKVLATWFSGELKVPQGEMLEYIHQGYDSIYELDLIFQFKNGIITDFKIFDNQSQRFKFTDFKAHFKNKIRKKIDSSTLIELIAIIKNELALENNNDENDKLEIFNLLPENSYLIDLSQWNRIQKEQLFLSALKGLASFALVLNNKSFFPFFSFNSIINAINGQDSIYIDIHSIKWLPEEIKQLVTSQNINFKHFDNNIIYANDIDGNFKLNTTLEIEIKKITNVILSENDVVDWLSDNCKNFLIAEKPQKCSQRTLPCMCYVIDKECLFIELYAKLNEKSKFFELNKYLEKELEVFREILTNEEAIKNWTLKNIEIGLKHKFSFNSPDYDNLKFSLINGKSNDEFEYLNIEIDGKAFKSIYDFVSLFIDLFILEKVLKEEYEKYITAEED